MELPDQTAFVSLSLVPAGDGHRVQMVLRGQTRLIGTLSPSGDPSFPWLTSAGQLEADVVVAALKLAAHVLEDEQLSLLFQLR